MAAFRGVTRHEQTASVWFISHASTSAVCFAALLCFRCNRTAIMGTYLQRGHNYLRCFSVGETAVICFIATDVSGLAGGGWPCVSR